MKKDIYLLKNNIDWDRSNSELKNLIEISERDGFWDDPNKAQNIMKEIKLKENMINLVNKINKDYIDLKELIELAEIENDSDLINELDNLNFPEANCFKRKAFNNHNIYHHLVIYCYQKDTLRKFVSYKQSHNEIKNKLEQLRALDNHININVALAKSSPIGVDTKEDFVAIKKIMEYKS